jgi:hypothetical protein
VIAALFAALSAARAVVEAEPEAKALVAGVR